MSTYTYSIGCALLLIVHATLAAAARVNIVFDGVQSCHLMYEALVTDPCVRVSLEVYKPDGSSQELASMPGPEPVSLSGTLKHEGLARGIHQYTIYRHVDGGDRMVVAGNGVVIDEHVAGSPLFSDTLNPYAAGFTNVSISGISLAISNGVTLTLANGVYYGQRMDVHGTLVLGDDTDTRYCPLWYHTPAALSGIQRAELVFKPGSGGSTIANSHTLTVYCETSVQMQGVTNAGVVVQPDKGSWTINNSELRFARLDNWQYTDGLNAGNTALHLGGCTVRGNELAVQSASAFTAVNTHFDTRVVFLTNVTSGTVFDSCTFSSGVSLDRGAPVFNSCELYGAAVGHSAAAFNNCVMWNRVDFNWASAGARPSFSGCSFIGEIALSWWGALPPPGGPIAIGPSYFGDEQGPLAGESSAQQPFLCRRGAEVWGGSAFEIAPPLKSGRFRTFKQRLPRVWLAGIIAGQNSIPHLPDTEEAWPPVMTKLMPHRDTLISLDLACNDRSMEDARVFARINGIEYAATRPAVIRRDHAGLPATRRRRAEHTVNIIVPPLHTTSAVAEVYLDTTAVTGYGETGTIEQLTEFTMRFEQPWPRQLRIAVVPVQLDIPGYARGIPDGAQFASRMKLTLAAMTALGTKDIETFVVPMQFSDYVSSYSKIVLLNRLASYVPAQLNYRRSLGDPGAMLGWDLTMVLLLPSVFPEGADGVSLPLRRSIIFTTPGKPESAVHEIGHAAGLYNVIEQYTWWAPLGLPVTGLTAFIPEPYVHVTGFDGDQSVIQHFAMPRLTWSQGIYYDVMGNAPYAWPLASTRKALNAYFYWRLNASAALAATAPPRAAGTRRILLEATARTSMAAGMPTLEIVPETFRVTDLSAANAQPIMYSSSPYLFQGQLYYLDTYNAANTLLESLPFRPIAYTNSSGIAPFSSVRDIPQDAVRYRVRSEFSSDPLWEASAGPAFTTTLVAPAPGTLLGDTVQIAWTSALAAAAATASGTAPPLRHVVQMSADGGATWHAISAPLEGFSFEYPTHALSGGTGYTFRVVSSDGFDADLSGAHHTILDEGTPSVTILSPREGDGAASGTLWRCEAIAYDREDGACSNLAWFSSRDGLLGDAGFVGACLLSPGAHTLQCIAMDSDGRAGTATVAVVVSEGEMLYQLQFATNALVVHVPGTVPQGAGSPVLATGLPHVVELSLRNAGQPASFSLELAAQPPGGAPQSIGTLFFSNLPPFETASLSVPYVPEGKGVFRFTGTVTNITPAGTVALTTMIAVERDSRAPATIEPIPSVLAFENVVPGSTESLRLTVRNAGEMPLQIGTVTISGTHAWAFHQHADHLSGATLGAGDARSLDVQFSPTQSMTHAAVLFIPSDDPLMPVCTIPVTDAVVPEPAAVVLAVLAALVRRRAS